MPGGSLRSSALRGIAQVAAGVGDRLGDRVGDGWVVELTNRANIQVRGVRPDRIANEVARLVRCGAVRPDGSGDARLNVMAGPLSGIDATETIDTRPMVDAVTSLLYRCAPRRLPAKFGVIIDGGGAVHLRGRRHDLALGAVRVGDDPAVKFEVALGDGLPIDRACGPEEVLVVSPHQLCATVEVVMRLCAQGERASDVVRRAGHGALIRQLAMELGTAARLVPTASVRSRTGLSGVPVGVGNGWAAGTPALGRLRADDLMALADVSDELSGGEIRITPWRSVLLPTSHPEAARRLHELGMCTDLLDPVQSVVACAGSTGCASGTADTQAHGRTLIDMMRRLPAAQRPASVHLSGCAKGCAGTAASAITFIATDPASDPSAAVYTYDMYRNSSVQRPRFPPLRVGVDAALAIASAPVASLPAGAAGA